MVFTGDWVTASLLKSPGLFSVFWPFSIVLLFGWSPLVRTSKSSSLFSNPLVTAPKAPISIGTIVTFMFQSFFDSLARSTYLILFSHSFSFILWSAGTAKSTILQIFFFCCWLLLLLLLLLLLHSIFDLIGFYDTTFDFFRALLLRAEEYIVAPLQRKKTPHINQCLMYGTKMDHMVRLQFWSFAITFSSTLIWIATR